MKGYLTQYPPISGPDAIWSKELAAREGIFVGISGWSAMFAGALKIAAEAEKGANILCMSCSTTR